MSSLIIEVSRVDEVRPHPNADRMAVARVKGWEVCVARDAATGEPWVKAGDLAVYFPPDSVLPPETADLFGVTKYLSPLPKNPDGTRPPGGRVRVASLRGFKSFGFLGPVGDPVWEEGRDVAGFYGVTKFDPPEKANAGDTERANPAFPTYFDMENLRHFPDALTPGEEVVCTEKIHGQNVRLGLIREADAEGVFRWTWCAGTHKVRRKHFYQKRGEDGEPTGVPVEAEVWKCFSPESRALMAHLSGSGLTPEEIDDVPPVADGAGADVIVFGERFGSGVQDLTYGQGQGRTAFRAFDVTVNLNYLGFEEKAALFARFGVPAVPTVYRGPYSFAAVAELAEGPTALEGGSGQIREGVVVLAIRERPLTAGRRLMSRAQFKCIGFAYLNRKDGTEFH